MNIIHATRLDLVSATVKTLEADMRGHVDLERALGVRVSRHWPPDLYGRQAAQFALDRIREQPADADWWTKYFIDRAARTVVGCGGFKGPPDAGGAVEIGYSILPEFRRRGYATEAAQALANHALRDPRVSVVAAETLPDLKDSIAVLERCGFARVGPTGVENIVRYEKRRP